MLCELDCDMRLLHLKRECLPSQVFNLKVLLKQTVREPRQKAYYTKEKVSRTASIKYTAVNKKIDSVEKSERNIDLLYFMTCCTIFNFHLPIIVT